MLSPSAITARTLAIVVLTLAAVTGAAAQCPNANSDAKVLPNVAAPPKPVRAEPILPEAGFLSNTHYTSQFFGFGFDLPLTVQGHEIMMPVMPEKQHVLLALQFEQAQQRGSIVVTAKDPVPGFDVNTPEAKEKQLEEWSKTGTQGGGLSQIQVPAFMLRSGHFYHRFSHRGHNYEAEYWVGINSYTVRVIVATNDEQFLHRAKDAMADARFYCPQDDGTLIDEKGATVKAPGEPYAGPTVPTFRVNMALHDEPGQNIPQGEVVDGVYHNAELGLRYELPKGWKPLPPDPGDPPLEPTALREYQFLHACSQTLLEATSQQQEENEGGVKPTLVLRALDPNCLALRTPVSLTDKRGADEVAASLEELGEFGELGSDQLISISGQLFMVLHGTIAMAPRGEQLGVRMSQTIFATRYDKLLLVWSLMAANSSALEQLSAGAVTLGDLPAIELRVKKR